MLMVIFGAGASYDSDPSRPAAVLPAVRLPGYEHVDRPPLAKELFDNREQFAKALNYYRQCSPIVPMLRGSSDIEQELERLQNEATEPPAYVDRLRQLAAVRGYLQLALGPCTDRWHEQAGGITNYLGLLGQILRWGHHRVLLVTFNYDRLLERAVTHFTRREFDSLDEYIRDDRFQIVKLHGSVNWGHVVTPMRIDLDNDWQIAGELIDRAEQIGLTSEYVVCNTYPVVRAPGNRFLVPAVAIPFHTKQHFECPETHLAVLKKALPEVQQMLIIGWRGMDQHFVAVLRDALAKDIRIQVVGNGVDDSRNIGNALVTAGVGMNFEPVDGGFSNYVTNRRGDDFFRHL